MIDPQVRSFGHGLAGAVLAICHRGMLGALGDKDPDRREGYTIDLCLLTERYGLPPGWWEDPSVLNWSHWKVPR